MFLGSLKLNEINGKEVPKEIKDKINETEKDIKTRAFKNTNVVASGNRLKIMFD